MNYLRRSQRAFLILYCLGSTFCFPRGLLGVEPRKVSLVDSHGAKATAELVEFSHEGLKTRSGAFRRDEIRAIDFTTSEARPLTAPLLSLTDGSQASLLSLTFSEDQFQVTSEYGTWSCPHQLVTSLLWNLPNSGRADWEEIASQSRSSDLLVFRRESGKLDYLKGELEGITSEGVTFQFNGNTVPAPWSRVVGLLLIPKQAKFPAVRLRLQLMTGDVWYLDRANSSENEIQMVSIGGVSVTLPWSALRSVEYPQLDADFLDTLTEEKWEFHPLVSGTLSDPLAQLFRPSVIRPNNSTHISVGTEKTQIEYERGVLLPPGTNLRYRLAGAYRRFQADVVLPTDRPEVDGELVVTTDGEEKFRRRVLVANGPVPIDIDVTGAARFEITTGFGERLNSSHDLFLGNARLVK